jgi:N-acetylneuraminic acid mutarotase
VIGIDIDASNSVATLYDPSAGVFSPTTNQPIIKRRYQTVTLLPSGKVLITGGNDLQNHLAILKSAEIYDPTTSSFSLLPSGMAQARGSHSAVLLDNGLVLITGGEDENNHILKSAEIYNPANDSFTLLGPSMTTARRDHTSVKLKNGTVLLIAGVNQNLGFLKDIEIFNPSTSTFRAAGEMIEDRKEGFSATLLPDGNVLITGGQGDIDRDTLRSAELYNAQTGMFEALPDMNDGRSSHFAILFQNDAYVLIGGGYMTVIGGAWDSLELYDIKNKVFQRANPMHFGRAAVQDAVASTSNGDVIVFGGDALSLESTELRNAEHIRSADISSSVIGGLNNFRIWHTSTSLQDGTVLITGGIGPQLSLFEPAAPVATAEIYDPVTDIFVPTSGLMKSARAFHTATRLGDGTVLITGGGISDTDTAELYLPSSKTFSSVSGQMSVNRDAGHTATLLKDGTVLITGGINDNGDVLDLAEIYDPRTKTFSGPTGKMTTARTFHAATILNDGRVLITGGGPTMSMADVLDTAEIYDPTTRTFTSIPFRMSSPRTLHAAIALNDGRVLIAGGFQNANSILDSADVYDPASGQFQVLAAKMTVPRAYHTVTALSSGRILITGGESTRTTSQASAEIFDPGSGRFAAVGDMKAQRFGHGASLLPSGAVVVTGGRYIDRGGQIPLETAEVYEP